MCRDAYHVIPMSSADWRVVRTGAEKSTRNFKEKRKAVTFAIEISNKNKTEVIIHKPDGSIEREFNQKIA